MEKTLEQCVGDSLAHSIQNLSQALLEFNNRAPRKVIRNSLAKSRLYMSNVEELLGFDLNEGIKLILKETEEKNHE